jgi:predicted Zn-dependent protease
MRSLLLILVTPLVFAAPQKKSSPKKEADEAAARGDAWTMGGNCDEAIKAYRRVLELDAARATVKVRLAHCLAQTNARAEAETLLASLGDDKSALLERADIAMANKEYRAAAELFEKLGDRASLLEALAAQSGDAAARGRALKLCAALKKDQMVDAPVRRRAEELESILLYGDAAADMIQAKAKLASGDARTAASLLEKVVLVHADLEEAQYLLGVAYAHPELGKRADARKAWKRAPHVKEAQLQLGVDAYEGGELDEALAALQAAVAIDPVYQAGHYQLGLVLHERGETDGAKKAWQSAIRIDPRSDLGRWASTKLQMLTGEVHALSEGQVIDASSEIAIGQRLGAQVTARFGKMDDPQLEARLEKILRKLAVVADRPDRELRYKIVLVDVAMINALTLPGGTILVFRGLVDLIKNKLGDKDDAWAAVLGHECAHAALRHGMGMIQVASSLAEGKAATYTGGGTGALMGLLNTVSRAHEFEADQFGTLYAYRAGFNPAASLALHEKMLAANGEVPRGMTHPQHAERMARMRDYLLDLRSKVHGFDLAVKALKSGDYNQAANRFEIFLGVFPDSLSARSNLGVAMHRQALAALPPSSSFRRTTDVDPDSRAKKIELRSGGPEVGGLKPKADERLLRDAIAEYRAALQLDPTYTHAQINLGAALDDLKDRKAARTTLESAVRSAPQSKEAWNNLGAVAAGTGDTVRALDALQKAVGLDGSYAEAWFNLGLTYEQAGKSKEAAAAWDKYLALDAKSGWSEVARTHRSKIQ